MNGNTGLCGLGHNMSKASVFPTAPSVLQAATSSVVPMAEDWLDCQALHPSWKHREVFHKSPVDAQTPTTRVLIGFPGDSDGKETACNSGDPGLIPGSGKFPGEGNDNPLQYSCLENPMDRGAWWATVHGIAKSQT